jgi:hypothetical protein
MTQSSTGPVALSHGFLVVMDWQGTLIATRVERFSNEELVRATSSITDVLPQFIEVVESSPGSALVRVDMNQRSPIELELRFAHLREGI